MTLHTLAFSLPLVFLLYQIVIDFADLFPFNDIRARDLRLRKFEVFGNYPPLVAIAVCFWLDSGTAHKIGYLLTTIILIMHLLAWWIPYMTGFPKQVKKDYNRYFSRTYKFLPPIKDHIVPDAEHVGVGALLLATFVVQSLYVGSI